MRVKAILVLLTVLMLAGCGKFGPLDPNPNQNPKYPRTYPPIK